MFTESTSIDEIRVSDDTLDEYYAAIDLGSNSFHMVIVRVLTGSVQIVSKTKHKVMLAAGLDDQNQLNQEAIERGLQCITNFSEKLIDIPIENTRIVATATLRLAANSHEFIEPAQEILKRKIDVISGLEEAKQIFLGVAYTSAHQGNSLVIDIGGASTEVILGRDVQPVYLTSLNMGCVTYMERYFAEGVLTKRGFDEAVQAAKKEIQQQRETFLCFDWQQCLGASGTPQAVTQIMVKQGINDAIRLSYLHQLKRACLEYSHISKLNIDGLPATRQTVFPSGLAILIALFESLNISNMQISGGALREGIIYGMLDNYQKSDRRKQGLNQLISKFHIDPTQSERAKQVVSRLGRETGLATYNSEFDALGVLQAAAMLHELGLHISYKYYQDHGAYILNHVEITGYTQLQRMIIRDLVGAHRNEIDLNIFSGYSDELRSQLEACLRLLRISIILISRRKDGAIPNIKLITNEQEWQLIMPKGIQQQYPLIHTGLIHECWLQHKAGWRLQLLDEHHQQQVHT